MHTLYRGGMAVVGGRPAPIAMNRATLGTNELVSCGRNGVAATAGDDGFGNRGA